MTGCSRTPRPSRKGWRTWMRSGNGGLRCTCPMPTAPSVSSRWKGTHWLFVGRSPVATYLAMNIFPDKRFFENDSSIYQNYFLKCLTNVPYVCLLIYENACGLIIGKREGIPTLPNQTFVLDKYVLRTKLKQSVKKFLRNCLFREMCRRSLIQVHTS